jgi:putative ABC transport system permease protein
LGFWYDVGSIPANIIDMWKNHLLIAFRNLSRNKAFSVINILGLAIGLATCLLIMVYVLDEASYDRQFKDVGQLYRVAIGAGGEGWAAGPAPLAAALKSDLPEVAEATRLMKFPDMDNTVLEYTQGKESRRFIEPNGYYVDSSFFNVLSYPFVAGDPQTALERPNSIVISQTIAEKLFGREDPIGHQIKVGLPLGRFDYTVGGVFRDQGLRTHIPAHFFLSMKNGDVGQWIATEDDWMMTNIFHTYVRLKPGSDPVAFEKKLNPFFRRRGGEAIKAFGLERGLILQPVKDIYLQSKLGDEIAPNGNIKSLYILGSIAVFILIIACINFMNLSTARSEHRAREVGVRKVMGAKKNALILQFLGESFLLCGIALALALLLTWLALPVFDAFTQKDLQPFKEPRLIGVIVGLTLFAGLLSGCYPAFYLSSFNPAAVLKGKLVHHLSAAILRKGLVVFQFTISIGLIVGAIVIARQMALFRNYDLGFDKDRQIVVPLQGKQEAANFDVLRDQLMKSPYIKSVSSGSSYPGIANINTMPFYSSGKTGKDFVELQMVSINNNYFQTLGLTLLSGRWLNSQQVADSSSIIVNATAIRKFGLDPATAIGKRVSYNWNGTPHVMTIVGIVKDFNFESLHNPITGIGFSTAFFGNKYSYLIAKIQTHDLRSALNNMGSTWNKINPATPFAYSFVDQDFARNYEKEQHTASLVLYFTVIAILIACLGLFGLTAFAAEQRMKEIGIRKVLGASAANVAVLLSGDLLRLVGIAVLIACPIAAYTMHKWLENFNYRTPLSWWIFPASAALAAFAALVTTGFQAIKAARTNPIVSLRSE